MIELRNIFKSFNNKVVLDDISLTINKGDIFGIIGYSGAGKSTLLRLINCLEKADSGDIIIDSENITNASSKDLRRLRQNIGMIFQNFNLLTSRDVFHNIALPLEIAGFTKAEIKIKVESLIKLVNLEGKEKQYVSKLSGGEKQRVGIARALANDPKVLLCDEATSALDPSNTKAILELLINIQRKTNITIVIITHEMDVVNEICNKVAVIDKGIIIEKGCTSNVFHNPKAGITKEFVLQGRHLKNIYEANDEAKYIVDNISGGYFLKLIFSSLIINSSIVAELILHFKLPFNIIEADINKIDGNTIGTIILHIDTNEATIEKMVSFLLQKSVIVEVINNNVALQNRSKI